MWPLKEALIGWLIIQQLHSLVLLQCWPLNVKPRNNKPRSSGKSNNSKFLLSPLTFFSLLSTLALAGFGKKWKTIPGPFKLLMRGL